MIQVGLFWQLEGVSNDALLGGLQRLVGSGRRVLAELVAHLGEVEQRRLHLDAGYSSLFAYCTAQLGMSEDEAYRRIVVARLGRRVPSILEHLATGALSLSAAALLKPHQDAPDLDELVHALLGKSVNAAREVLAARFPEPDVPSTLRKLPQPHVPSPGARPLPETPDAPQPPLLGRVLEPMLAPRGGSRTVPTPSPMVPRTSRAIEPLSAARYRIQFTADKSLKEKLELARDLLRHSIPSGDFAALLDRALDLLITEHMKRRFGTRTTQRAPRERPETAAIARAAGVTAGATTNATVSRPTRRSVLERDGLRCTWQGTDGVRCSARAWLERDHRHPRARGGPSTVENVRHLCRAHNRRAAELAFGERHVERAMTNARRHRCRVSSPGP